MNRYIAVTIGPIFDTINLASSPSALWAASYMFSMLTKNICKTLTENGVSEEDIISPYYSRSDPLADRKDGVGLFHDRIIFHADNFDISCFDDKVKFPAIEKTIALFGYGENHIDYFNDYFSVSAVAYDSDSPILDSAKMLDCLELSKSFVRDEESNPILSMYTSDSDVFEGEEYYSKNQGRNKNLLRAVDKMGLTEWQLYRPNHDGICSLGDIAGRYIPKSLRHKKKKYSYFAVVRSDGDHMGDIIASLKTTEQIREFSHTCMQYCSDIADAVKQYEGITIYSGGDDLLAILPVENSSKQNIFDFVAQANEIFAKRFESFHQDSISLSFGIMICYHKYPLYEALEESARLLYNVAKSYRKSITIHLQKHAGQSESLIIENGSLERFLNFYREIINDCGEESDEALLSSMHKITMFDRMFNSVKSTEEINHLFNNTFDSQSHIGNQFIEKILPQFYYDLQNTLDIRTIYEVDNQNENKAGVMNAILRIIKFFVEGKGGEEE